MRHSATPVHATPLRLYFLGSFRIELKGQVVCLPTRKIESLLAYLLLFPEAHPREKLAALFWGDVPDEQARMSLRTALTALRKRLGRDLFIADRELVQINSGFPVWVDAREFSDSPLITADSNSAIRDLQSVITLYRGDLLSDFYDDWILQERARLRARYLDMLLTLTQQARAASEYARAIELAQQVIASDPANETAHQHMIFCFGASGNRVAARNQYEACCRSLRAELNAEPSPETTALYEWVETQTRVPAREALLTNLPIPLTSFVGRRAEMTEIRNLLATARLLTLTGAGGCGKTRLAIQVATDLAREKHFKDGVWWVDLAALNDAALVVQSIAAVFDVRESSQAPLITALANYLRAKDALLVLDNCEHVLGACAQLAGTLLSGCLYLRILATSRETFNISGETAWRVPSLALPGVEDLLPLDQLRRYDAIQLFAERALAVAANWRLVGNTESVAQICTRLDGIPLAIELAAVRLKGMTAQQIAERLKDRFELLTGGNRMTIPRHQTLRAALDWSYDLLSDAERSLLRRLSVFAGGFTLEAVQFIWAGEPESGSVGKESHPLDLLTSLIDKSLVIETHNPTTRYHLLETVRQYARGKLIEAGEAISVQARHCEHFVEWIEQASPQLWRADAIEWRDRIEWDHDNLRAALEYATDHDPRIALRIAWALRQFWSWRGYVPEGLARLNRLLPKTEAWGQSAPRARAFTLGAFLAHQEWNLTAAKRFAEQALAIARTVEEPQEIGLALQRVGYSSLFTIPPDYILAVKYLQESREIFQALGDQTMLAWSTHVLGIAFAGCGEMARGMSLIQQVLAMCRASGDQLGAMIAVSSLGLITLRAGDYESSARYNEESIELGRELQNTVNFLQALSLLAACYIKLNAPQRALPCAEQVMRLYQEQGSITGTVIGLEEIALCIGTLGKPGSAARLFGKVELERQAKRSGEFVVPGIFEPERTIIRAQLGEGAFDQARAEGREMSLNQAVEYALEDLKGV